MHTIQRQISRTLAAGALSLALLSAGGAGALAAEAKPKPSPSPSVMPSITVKASTTSVKAGGSVTFTGETKGLRTGFPLVLQHQKGGKWFPLRASTKTRSGHTYSLTAKLNTVGTEHLRISAVGKKVYSPVVTVKVS
ncbi:hypothetical protein AB0M11_26195 [Streptomyces sp. NPDC051987]|uniref:hypothetical protein n=1 Tax=Streptomyces sp. NPDC051987 TaxID=3155808 RepID=UPI003434A07D